MKLHWQVTDADIQRVRRLIEQQKGNAFVKARLERNCAAVKEPIGRARFWQQMVCMRLTSQQNSSPNGPVARFSRQQPFLLGYDIISKSNDREGLITRVLNEWRGIRHVPTIADQLSHNFAMLEQGEWDRSLNECNRLTTNVSRVTEIDVARYIQDTFSGFGPKQSRNLLQSLWLTRYEIPIDSRVIDWLNEEFQFPVRLSSEALSDINYYIFVSDGIQELCEKSGVIPCVFDAAIFALKDGDNWTAENAF